MLEGVIINKQRSRVIYAPKNPDILIASAELFERESVVILVLKQPIYEKI